MTSSKLLIRTVILISLLHASWTSSCQKSGDELVERIRRIENGLQRNLQIVGEIVPTYNIEERMKELNIPGLSIAVITDGKIEWAKGYGYADVAEGRKVTTETLFRAASISKPITALRVLQLAEEGKIDLDANVNDYLTAWKVPENRYTTYKKVTPRRILSHSAGLTVSGFIGYSKDDAVPNVVEILDGKGKDGPVRVFREPGKDRTYSGGGYEILHLLISEIDQQPFEVTMQEHVLNKLGMTGSTFTAPLPLKFHPVAATQYRPNGNEMKGKWPVYPELAAAGLWTTPSDLAMYILAIQKIWFTKEEGILTYETVRDMLTEGKGQSGLGPKIGKHVFVHGGGSKGNRSLFFGWKETANGVAIMVNTDNDLIIQEL
ncbi:MAG: serine hydrolase domain-containing protein, partial [Cyclobacteriaceae bacterium]